MKWSSNNKKKGLQMTNKISNCRAPRRLMYKFFNLDIGNQKKIGSRCSQNCNIGFPFPFSVYLVWGIRIFKLNT